MGSSKKDAAVLGRVLGDWVLDVQRSQNLVVLRAHPGSAHVVAAALDRSDIEGVLGTVAGDDTLLIVCAEHSSAPELERQLRDLANL